MSGSFMFGMVVMISPLCHDMAKHYKGKDFSVKVNPAGGQGWYLFLPGSDQKPADCRGGFLSWPTQPIDPEGQDGDVVELRRSLGECSYIFKDTVTYCLGRKVMLPSDPLCETSVAV